MLSCIPMLLFTNKPSKYIGGGKKPIAADEICTNLLSDCEYEEKDIVTGSLMSSSYISLFLLLFTGAGINVFIICIFYFCLAGVYISLNTGIIPSRNKQTNKTSPQNPELSEF